MPRDTAGGRRLRGLVHGRTLTAVEDERLRIVRVASPSARSETGAVIRAIVHIVVWSALLIGVERAAARSGTAGQETGAAAGGYLVDMPFGQLPAPDQRIYRMLRAAEGDLEDARSSTGQWPAVAALVARALPPFAPDPIDKGGYQWSLLRDPAVASYVGVPTDAARPTFLLTFLEPAPGTAKDSDGADRRGPPPAHRRHHAARRHLGRFRTARAHRAAGRTGAAGRLAPGHARRVIVPATRVMKKQMVSARTTAPPVGTRHRVDAAMPAMPATTARAMLQAR